MIKGYAVYFRNTLVAAYHEEDAAYEHVSGLEEGGEYRDYDVRVEELSEHEFDDEPEVVATIN